MSTDRLTEMLNYLSAISRDVGELRSEVRANTAKIEDLRTEVNAKMEDLRTDLEGLRTEVRTGFEEVRSDIRHLKHKLEIVTEDLMELRTDQRDLRKRTEVLERG